MPLSAIAHFEPTTAPLSVNHQGQFPSVTVSFNLAPGVALSDAATGYRQMEQQDGHAGTIHGMFSGTLQAFQASLATEPLLILTALMAVYIVLGILYESLHSSDHDSFDAAVGRSGRGAGADAFPHGPERHRDDRNHPADRHREEKRDHDDRFRAGGRAQENKTSEDAIFQACLLRFRPILMTTMAAIAAPCRWRSARAPARNCAGRWESPSSAD